MYIWNIDKLVKDLKDEKLPARTVKLFSVLSPVLSIFNAILFSIILLTHQIISQIFANFLFKDDPYLVYYNKIGWFMGILATCFTFYGFYLCYKTNQKGDGKNFFKRLTCLSFPIYFQLTLFTLSLIMIFMCLGFLFFQFKIAYFKYMILLKSKTDVTIAEQIKSVVEGSPLESLIGKVPQNKRNFFKVIFGAPAAIARIPLLPGKISQFLNDLRSNLLSVYPFLTLLPPALALSHYLVVRRKLRKVCGAKK